MSLSNSPPSQVYATSVGSGPTSSIFLGEEATNMLILQASYKWVGPSLRHLSSASVCDQHVGMSLNHLPTAGVCNQRVGVFLDICPAQVYATSMSICLLDKCP